MLRELVLTSGAWATVPLRLVLGVFFTLNGLQKVFGSFSGHGLRAFTSFPPPFSFMKPGWLWMGTAAFAELIGGVLVLPGIFTRLGAFLISCVILVAIFGILWPKFFAPEGMELATAFLAMALGLLMTGGVICRSIGCSASFTRRSDNGAGPG